jgi:hypothetical protein
MRHQGGGISDVTSKTWFCPSEDGKTGTKLRYVFDVANTIHNRFSWHARIL